MSKSTLDPETLQRLRRLAEHLQAVVTVMSMGKGTYKEQPSTPPEYDWIVGGFGIADLKRRAKEKQLTESKDTVTSLTA